MWCTDCWSSCSDFHIIRITGCYLKKCSMTALAIFQSFCVLQNDIEHPVSSANFYGRIEDLICQPDFGRCPISKGPSASQMITN